MPDKIKVQYKIKSKRAIREEAAQLRQQELAEQRPQKQIELERLISKIKAEYTYKGRKNNRQVYGCTLKFDGRQYTFEIHRKGELRSTNPTPALKYLLESMQSLGFEGCDFNRVKVFYGYDESEREEIEEFIAAAQKNVQGFQRLFGNYARLFYEGVGAEYPF